MQTLYFPQTHRVFGTQDLDDCLRDWAKSFIAPPSLIPRFNILSIPQVILNDFFNFSMIESNNKYIYRLGNVFIIFLAIALALLPV